ncbi:MAG: type II secretion system GspH family protein [Candidatus Gastranaerophilales bacterium]|nr:type II secretion system GspH family protein [Candidatus Gastranaerophilales bacterium]
MKNHGFTLSEVLITLVIIGIIAAVTVPTLMANYKKQETSSRLKKFYSNLSQAVRLAEIENPGFMKSTYSARINDTANWWNDTIGKYMPVTKQENTSYVIKSTSDGDYTPDYIYTFNDGSFIAAFSTYKCVSGISFYYDINGQKSPNTSSKDVFYFHIGQYDESSQKIHLTKVCSGEGCTTRWNRNNTLKSCQNHIDYTSACTTLLQLDGWEVKDDYPWL